MNARVASALCLIVAVPLGCYTFLSFFFAAAPLALVLSALFAFATTLLVAMGVVGWRFARSGSASAARPVLLAVSGLIANIALLLFCLWLPAMTPLPVIGTVVALLYAWAALRR